MNPQAQPDNPRQAASPQPDDVDYPWGADGSDLHMPVRAHVEAALIPATGPYPEPLARLLELGDPSDLDAAGRDLYEPLGITQAHAPDLVRMTRDRSLVTAWSDTKEVWAPTHALTALALLDIRDYVDDLIPLFDLDDDWIGEEAPGIIANAGSSAFPTLKRVIHDRSRWIFGRERAMRTLVKAVKQSPELHDEAVRILEEVLKQAAEDDAEFNGFVVSSLLDLDAQEALPTIRAAFEQNAVDETIVGDWPEVLSELGETPDPNDPLVKQSRAHAQLTRQSHPLFGMHLLQPDTPAPSKSKKKKSSQKNKRKMVSASRKANRKKK